MEQRKPLLKCAVIGVCSLAATAFALDATSALSRGWAPLVAMHGAGDTQRAVSSLRAANKAMDVILAHTELDAPTEKFVKQAWQELEDFHLDDFYELLPTKNGAFREIGVTGAVQGSAFRIHEADLKKPFEVTLKGPRKNLADFSAVLRAKPTRAHGEHNAFLLQGRAGFGIGAISWNGLTDALTATLRLVSTGDPRPGSALPPQASEGARARMRVLHPKLAEEDLEVVALLHDAFPATSEAVGEIARIDDLRVSSSGTAYSKIRASVRILPERMKQHYPDLAKHLDKLDQLAHAKIRQVDSRGRSIFEAEVDTDKLSAVIECYVKDGLILPFTRDGVAVDEPIDPMGNQLARSRVLIDARIKMLGVVIHLDHLRADLRYTQHGSYAEVHSATTTLPGIRVEGAALGFVPTGLVDAFIPGNIESLTRDFFDVAVRGNDGKGVTLDVTAGSVAAGQPGALELALGVEALDNFMVKMGVGIVNQRVVPDEDESEEADRLNLRLHQAFSKDFERFAARAKSPG